MSQLPPDPPSLAEMPLNYQTPPINGNAPTLLRLAGIFSLISSGIDLIQIMMSIGMIVFMHFMMASIIAAGAAAPPPGAPAPALAPPANPTATAPDLPLPESVPAAAPLPAAPAPPAPGPFIVARPGAGAPGAPPPEWLFIVMYGIPGSLSLLVIGFKIFGSLKILRGGKRAWGWGLATGIIGCCEWWMFTPCCVMIILPVSAGIYTIIIHCLPHVRLYVNSKHSTIS